MDKNTTQNSPKHAISSEKFNRELGPCPDQLLQWKGTFSPPHSLLHAPNQAFWIYPFIPP